MIRKLLISALILLAGCTEPRIHPSSHIIEPSTTSTPSAVRGLQVPADAQAVRDALLAMVNAAGNRWMAEDLLSQPIIKKADHYCVGRWQFSLDQMTFSFEHTNRAVQPPILFNVTGTLERSPTGQFTAKVTSKRQS